MEKKYSLNCLAASELTGTLILSGLIVLVIGIISVALLSQGPPGEVPALRVDIHNESGNLILINRGGDTLFREKTRIFVDGEDKTGDFLIESTSWGEFRAGDWLVLPSSIMPHRDDISVQIVHTGPEVPALLFTIGKIGVPPGPWEEDYRLTLSSSPPGAGTLSGGGVYVAGRKVAVNAIANPGWSFVRWTRNGGTVSLLPGFTYTMPSGNVQLVAHFEEDPTVRYNLTLGADPLLGGTVNGAGLYEEGEGVPVSAEPSAGYQFINWTRNGVEIANTSAFTFTMPAEDVTLVANFEQVKADGFTVEAWVRWNRDPAPPDWTHNFATIVVDGTNDTNRRYHLQHIENNTKFELVMRTGEAAPGSQRIVRSATTPEHDTWYYVAGVYNQTLGEIVLYVNGIPDIGQQFGAISTAGLIPSPNLYQVGGPDGITWFTTQTDRRKFDGNILCLQTHERALTPQEILDRYNAGCPPVVDFAANVTTGTSPLTVQFTDLTSHSPTAWEWDFGDGGTSTAQHPTHTYLTPGNYTVSLTVTKKDVNNLDANVIGTKTDYITIIDEEKSFVDFVIDENVFVYGNVLNFQGGNVNGPGATVVVTSGMSTADTNLGAAINVTTIYIDGDVNLLSGSASLGSPTNPGNIYVNGNLRFGDGERNIHGDVYVAGNFNLKDARIHGKVYVDGDLTLDWTPWLADDARIYYTGSFTHPPTMHQHILDKCIHQSTVPGFDMPDQEIPPTKAAEWYEARGYVSSGALTSNMKVFSNNYSFEPTGSMNAQNVIIVAYDGDITLRRWGGSVTGVLFAPKGKVTFVGDSFEGLVIARDGFFVESGGTQVTFKNLDQYIGDPNDYPF